MPARITATAWRRGATNALIWSLILLVGWMLVAQLISSVLHHSFGESFWLAWAFRWGLTFLLFLGTWLYGLNAGGRILLDCGPGSHPDQPPHLRLQTAVTASLLRQIQGSATSSLVSYLLPQPCLEGIADQTGYKPS